MQNVGSTVMPMLTTQHTCRNLPKYETQVTCDRRKKSPLQGYTYTAETSMHRIMQYSTTTGMPSKKNKNLPRTSVQFLNSPCIAVLVQSSVLHQLLEALHSDLPFFFNLRRVYLICIFSKLSERSRRRHVWEMGNVSCQTVWTYGTFALVFTQGPCTTMLAVEAIGTGVEYQTRRGEGNNGEQEHDLVRYACL